MANIQNKAKKEYLEAYDSSVLDKYAKSLSEIEKQFSSIAENAVANSQVINSVWERAMNTDSIQRKISLLSELKKNEVKNAQEIARIQEEVNAERISNAKQLNSRLQKLNKDYQAQDRKAKIDAEKANFSALNSVQKAEFAKQKAEAVKAEREKVQAFKAEVEKERAVLKLTMSDEEVEEQLKDSISKLKDMEADLDINANISANYSAASGITSSRNRAADKAASYAEKFNTRATEKRQAKIDDIAAKGGDPSSFWNQFSVNMAGSMNELAGNLMGGLTNILQDKFAAMDKLIDSFETLIKPALRVYEEMMPKIDTRLQGTELTFKKISNDYQSAFTASPYVSMQKLFDNLDELTKKGIAYNVEERAFLATVSDRIATTFDAFDANLLRIIRLQQADTTASRLGLERLLTKLLNEEYLDRSYLEGPYDTVAGNLIDASSQMTRDQSIAFEGAVQKWLGALNALGLSSNVINNLSEGINYLSTGDVSKLSSNSGLQTLLVMAANRAGWSYADMLTGGLNSEATNDLLRAMVEYLKEIAKTENQVVKNSYATMFGMSLSDFRAFQNMTESDINSLYSTTIDYSKTMDDASQGLKTIGKRMHLATELSTLLDNAKFSLGAGIAGNEVMYGLWKSFDVIRQLTKPFAVSGIPAIANKVATTAQFVQIGLSGINTLKNAYKSISKGKLDTGFIPWDEYTTRGEGFVSSVGGIQKGLSQSAANDSSEDVESLSSNASFNSELKKYTDEMSQAVEDSVADKTAADIYGALFSSRQPILVEVVNMPNSSEGSSTSSGAGGLSSGSASSQQQAEQALQGMINLSTALDSGKPLNVQVVNDSLKVNSTLAGIDSDIERKIKTYIERVVLETIINALSEGFYGGDLESDDDEQYSIRDVINKIMNDQMGVIVKNSRFDEMITKYNDFR